MKAFFYKTTSHVLLLLVITIGLTACDKEDNYNHFRLKAINNYTNDLFKGGTRFIYDGKDIWEIWTRYENGDSSRTEYSYPESDMAVESYYYFNGFSWSYKGKIEYIYQDKYLSQIIDYNYDEPEIKIALYYENNDLKEELMSEFYDGNWNESAKITYTYSVGKLVQTVFYKKISGIWLIDGKEEVTYNDDSLNIIVEYDYHQENYYEVWKYEFLYEAERLVSTTAYHKLFDEWMLKFQKTYTYDEDGNLATESYIQSGVTKRSDLIYENNEGNLGQFNYCGGGATGILFQAPMIQMRNPIQENNKYKKWLSIIS